MSSSPSAASVESLIDNARWSGFQKGIVFLTALAVVLDGLDNQLLGFAIPALVKDWGVDRGAFSPIIAASLLAMTFGTAVAGYLGDKYGRRPTLIASVALFGAGTLAIAFVNDINTLFALRVISALGLGGAMPNATALLAEYTPAQRRSLAVTLGIVCVPVGGLLGGLAAAVILPTFGWRALFILGGVIPLVVATVMLFALPESPAVLARRPERRDELRRVLDRCGIALTDDVNLTAAARESAKSSVLDLFKISYLRDTIALWVAFFACLLAVYLVFNWAPTLLSTQGFDLAMSSTGLAVFNFGGIAGSLIGAGLIDRFGSRRPTIAIALMAAVCATGLALGTYDGGTNAVFMLIMLAILGAGIAGLQVLLFALAAHVYITQMRATGVGAALAVGRLGAVLSSYWGNTLIGGGVDVYFGFIAVAMVVTAIALLIITRHSRAAVRV